MRKIISLFILLLLTSYCWGQGSEQRSPAIQVQNLHGNETPVRITNVGIDVKVVGSLAVTTVEMTFYNPNSRILEGELQFPLAEGQNISRFALDINGKMREGVVVEKARGQEVFESIVRQGVDPGLLEKTQGNNFKTRVYPLFARGTRKVIIAYEQELPKTGEGYRFFLPVDYGDELDNFKLDVSVYGEYSQPKVDKTPWGSFSFNRSGDVYQASYVTQKYKAAGQLVFSLPVKNEGITFVEKGAMSNETVFYSQIFPVVEDQSKRAPKHIALYWDASSSMGKRNFRLEADLLTDYFKQLGADVTVDLYTFNCILRQAQQFSIKDGDWGNLKKTLEQTPYDGATRLGLLDFGGVKADEILLFSDGMNNFGKLVPQAGSIPVSVISSSLSADYSMLKYIASVTGGKYINLLQQTPQDALKLLKNESLRLISTLYNKNEISDLAISGTIIKPESGFSMAGKLNVSKASVILNFGVGDRILATETVTIDYRNIGDYGNIVERVWAEKKIAELDMLFDRNKEEIEEIGRKYNIVTRNTSLIVLENVSDYVRYKIAPPAELLDEYNRRVRQIDEDEKAARVRQIDRVISLFNNRKTWWKRDFSLDQKRSEAVKIDPVPESDPQPVSRPIQPQRSGSVSGIITDSSGEGLVGVTVMIKGTNIGTITDLDGRYFIDADNEDILVFSYIGYEKKEAKVRNRTTNVILEESQAVLEEVVVTGYATQRKESRTGSMSIVSEALQGRVAGFNVEQPANEDMLTREYLSFNAGNDQGTINRANATIELKRWQANAPYINVLKSKSDKELYASYLEIRDEYKATPSFFLDVASLFEERGLKEEALIILSNLAELETENYRLLRVLAYRLKQLGYNEYAIDQFESVLALRPEEPQSYRDLALAYVQDKKYQEAVDILYKIIERRWDGRFPEIEVIAAEEMNQVITKAKRENISLNLLNIDEKLIYNMPVDIRIVLNWDTDNSDMDLWVTDPYDEKCYYKHRHTKTGGFISNDFTGGYGPEEFLLKKAAKGKYKIQANYYGSREQTLVGPTTIYLDIYTYYATGEEKKETITMRLSQNKQVVNVGEVMFE